MVPSMSSDTNMTLHMNNRILFLERLEFIIGIYGYLFFLWINLHIIWLYKLPVSATNDDEVKALEDFEFVSL
jgi:hypothetical protein